MQLSFASCIEVQYSIHMYWDLYILAPLPQLLFWLFAPQTLLVYCLPISLSVMIQHMLKEYSQVNL